MKTKYLLLGGAVVLVGASAWFGSGYFAGTNSLGPTSTTSSSVSPEATTSTTDSAAEGVSLIEFVVARGVAISAAGDTRVESPGEFVATFDSDTLVRELVYLDPSDPSITITEGVVPGGPDFSDPLLREVAIAQSHFAQAVSDGSGTIADRLGRSELTFTIALTPDPELVALGLPYGVSRFITIDVATWSVVSILVSMSDGTVAAIGEEAGVRFEDRPRLDLHPSATAAGEVTRHQGGFRRLDLDRAQQDAGYAIPTVGWTPEGFSLALVAFGTSPLSYVDGTRNVTVLCYLNQTAQLTITIRDAGTRTAWTDPWNPGGDYEIDGVYKYESAIGSWEIAPAGYDVAHAWAVVGNTLITVSGAISTQDIERLVDSLALAG